jgi:hypothetical protein
MEKDREKFRKSLTDSILKYSEYARQGEKDCRIGMMEVVEGVMHLLASVTASAALTVDMDREKFAIYMHEVSKDLKQFAMKLYVKGRERYGTSSEG